MLLVMAKERHDAFKRLKDSSWWMVRKQFGVAKEF